MTAVPRTTAPKPPAHLFRTIKLLSSSAAPTATYLCLPRNLPPSPTPLSKHLLIIKTATTTSHLRHELSILEHLHLTASPSPPYIGPEILQCQLTSSPCSSWLIFRPISGPTIGGYGNAYKTNSRSGSEGGIPDWFIAHILLGVIDAVEFLHGEGVIHGGVSSADVMLDTRESGVGYRYRGYPDVVLIGFSGAVRSDAERDEVNDVRRVLGVVDEVVREWSGLGAFLGEEMVQESEGDGLAGVMKRVREFLGVAVVSMEGVREQLGGLLVDVRNGGPAIFPAWMWKLLKSDLATEQELVRAIRTPTAFKFTQKKDGLMAIVEKLPTVMGSGGHAGMKTKRIMVMRFPTKKEGLLKALGEEVDMEDVEMGDIEPRSKGTRSSSGGT